MQHSTKRLRAAVTAAAVVAAVSTAAGLAPAAIAGPAHAARRTTTSAPATAAKYAAGWLARDLQGGTHYQDSFGPEYGNTADGILAMTAAGVARSRAGRATTWLARHISGYVKDPKKYCGTTTTYSPGALGKSLVVAAAEGRDVHRFGGVDLVARLRASEARSGLFTDPNTNCGFETPITQALALIGLQSSGAHPDRRAIRWLIRQQCANGGYVGGIRQTSTPCKASTEDADATGFALQALVAVRATRAAGNAAAWLVHHQARDGGFGGKPMGENTNSTAVAVQGLLAAGRTHRARAGQHWLAARQVGCAGKAADRGSLDYQSQDVGGDTQLTATAQGTQALAGGVLGKIRRNRAATNASPVMACR